MLNSIILTSGIWNDQAEAIDDFIAGFIGVIAVVFVLVCIATQVVGRINGEK